MQQCAARELERSEHIIRRPDLAGCAKRLVSGRSVHQETFWALNQRASLGPLNVRSNYINRSSRLRLANDIKPL